MRELVDFTNLISEIDCISNVRKKFYISILNKRFEILKGMNKN